MFIILKEKRKNPYNYILSFLFCGALIGSVFYLISYIYWNIPFLDILNMGNIDETSNIIFWDDASIYLVRKRIFQFLLFLFVKYMFNDVISICITAFAIGFSYNCFICNLFMQYHFHGVVFGELLLMPSSCIYLVILHCWNLWFRKDEYLYYGQYVSKIKNEIVVNLCKIFVIILLLVVAIMIEIIFSKIFQNIFLQHLVF